MKLTGEIKNLYSETKSGRTGPFQVWYADLDSGETIEIGYKVGSYAQGQTFSGEVHKSYGKWKVGVGTSTGAAGNSDGATVSSERSASAFPFVNNDRREMSIVRQNSLAHAVATVTAQESFERDRAVTNGVTYEMLTDDEFAERVIKLAYHYADYSSGQRELKAAGVEDIIGG